MNPDPMKKILVVDDEPDISDMLKTYLGGAGYTAITASTAAEALDILELEKPKVVLLDIVMRDMDGLECLKKIKKAAPETIVIMVSGLQDEEIAKDAIRFGAYEYLTKPFDFDYLRESVLKRIF